jgi:magnesium chelatase subunit H
MKITVLYVGSSLLAPLRQAEREINEQYQLGLHLAAVNCTLPLDDREWAAALKDLADSDVVFVIHVTDSENAARIGAALDQYRSHTGAVIAMNCLPDLMRRLRMGKLDGLRIADGVSSIEKSEAFRLFRKLSSWMAGFAQSKIRNPRVPTIRNRRERQYLKLVEHIPTILRFVPSSGKLRDVKHYLTLFSYFMQPTPANVRAMLLYAIKHYVPGYQKQLKIAPPESRPPVAIYHPDAPSLLESFSDYRKWYDRTRFRFDSSQAIGLLLLRPQIMSGARRHYDGLIRAMEAEGLPVLPVISTFMDNREACQAFFVEPDTHTPRVSQIVSLTGFSFVGGPAGQWSEAAVSYLRALNRPFRTAISMDLQTVESWADSMIGLNPVQTVMQVAIPEIDGATEPLVFAGLPAGKDQPEPLEDRCRRMARRLARWQRLRLRKRAAVRLAFIIYCFPPNKGNLGTAADLDVFPSLSRIFQRLKAEGYTIDSGEDPDVLRDMVLGQWSVVRGPWSVVKDNAADEGQRTTDNGQRTTDQGHLAHVAYRMSADEYLRLCPYVEAIEAEWGPAPGQINSQGRDILIHGIELGNIFLGVQPTFGYEGDPMRLLMAKGGAPHHGFAGLYTYVDKIFRADALVHVGTHGALEFMPGKQVGLSSCCWPDRLIGELPNIYIYSVNNPSEGTIAKRRSYAELISYLTPPIEHAGLYKELASLKELITAYRQTTDEKQREHLFAAMTEKAQQLNLREWMSP